MTCDRLSYYSKVSTLPLPAGLYLATALYSHYSSPYTATLPTVHNVHTAVNIIVHTTVHGTAFSYFY